MFQPIVPTTGVAGWRFVQQTYDQQFTAFSKSPALARDTEYFRENIGSITSAEDLVKDRRLLTVALGAYGLQEDINSQFFIQKILEEGTSSSDTLANRFSDTRYKDLSRAFGFGPGELRAATLPGFAQNVISRFEANSFEVAAGETNPAIRVALYGQRELLELAVGDQSNDAKWFTILGDPPLRQLFEGALGMSSAIGQVDIDRQLEEFKDRAKSVFGTDDISVFSDKSTRDNAINRFVIRDQLDNFSGGQSSATIALTLLQS